VTAAYDVVVGVRVLVLEAAPKEHHGGNSGHAGANFPSLASTAAIRPTQTPATT
jgi:hypothetical protein